jgi:hypothetical protein
MDGNLTQGDGRAAETETVATGTDKTVTERLTGLLHRAV